MGSSVTPPRSWGCMLRIRTPEQTWLSSNGRAAELVLVKSDENATHTIGLEALTVEAVREAESRVEAAGCRVLSSKPSLECIKAGVTFATPEGLRFEIHTPIRNGIYDRRHPTYGVGPSRLDHANLMTPDPRRNAAAPERHRRDEALGEDGE